MKQRLLVDMDGVLADIYAQLIEFEYQDLGIRQSYEKMNGTSEVNTFKNALEYIFSDGFFRNLPVMEGSIEVMRQLNEQYELFIVSAAMEFPKSLTDKFYWLEEHFPFLHWKQIVMCGSKTAVKGDIMIDDHFKNLDYFNGKTLLFSQPHNISGNTKNHTRVDSWSDVAKILL